MAFFRGPQSPREEQLPTNPLSPPQQGQNRWSASMAGNNDVRGSLHRRFTTNAVPTLSPIGQQRRQAAAGDVQQAVSAMNRMSLGERKQQRYEALLDIQRRVQQELDQVDNETRREVDENRRHERSVSQLFAQSEPTTPPEYNNAFPTSFTRPNRYSATSLTSPPGIATRPHRASTQLTSPPISYSHVYNNGVNAQGLPSQSVPGSRRQSDDEEDDDDFLYDFANGNHRAAAKPNRNSMPITSIDRKRNAVDLSLGPVNTTGFLFDDDSHRTALPVKSTQTSPPDTKTYLQVQHTADGFPKLIRREETGDTAFTPQSSTLDLTPAPQQQNGNESYTGARQRISLPPNGLGSSFSIAPLNSILASTSDVRPATSAARNSVDFKYPADTKRMSLLSSPQRGPPNGHHIASSFSTNDLPTMKSFANEKVELNGQGSFQLGTSTSMNTTTTAEPSLPGLTRITSNPTRGAQDFASSSKVETASEFVPNTSVLQANAPAFGPFAQNNQQNPFVNSLINPFGSPQGFYHGYNVQGLTGQFMPPLMNGMNNFAQQPVFNGYTLMPAGFNAYMPQSFGPVQPAQAAHPASRFEANRPAANRRPHHQLNAADEAQAKYNSITLESLVGNIYSLCKDQHGCRFLQKKLEERNEATVAMIFDEVKMHMIELMIDPFGNYLCQKLMESATDDQRLVLITNAAPSMTKIALNQHGTRALQKMIECVKTPEHTNVIIEALRNDVVALIQDLNGNHVIQKCLNHLSSQDAQFIFDAVGQNCITVGTHRHGCCVLQRCIDHADGLQKGELVDHVIDNSYTLVQDPFGNYVVQYILDLAEPCFIEPLSKKFLTHILELSKQKFSSNVIEKCIRVSSDDTRRLIVLEIISPSTMEKMLRDGFGNYVIQTAMDFADEQTKLLLINDLRQLLPTIRNTPHGRRIASKITEYDNRNSTPQAVTLSHLESAQAMPNMTQAPAQSTVTNRANRHGIVGAPANWSPDVNPGVGSFESFGNGYNANSIYAPTPQRTSINYAALNESNPLQLNGNGHLEGFNNMPPTHHHTKLSYSNGANNMVTFNGMANHK